MSKKYIAYGSNLSVEQMAHRCPDATVVGMAAMSFSSVTLAIRI